MQNKFYYNKEVSTRSCTDIKIMANEDKRPHYNTLIFMNGTKREETLREATGQNLLRKDV